jgi:peptidyl-tRNA hydrolase
MGHKVSPEQIAKQRATLAATLAKPGVKERIQAASIAAQQYPAIKAKHKAACKQWAEKRQPWKDPVIREKLEAGRKKAVAKLKELYKDPEFRERHRQAIICGMKQKQQTTQ